MKKNFFVGISVLFLLAQISFISPIAYSYCENVSSQNYDSCIEIINLNLNKQDKILLIESLDEYYVIQDIPKYQGLFTSDQTPVQNIPNDYDPKENIKEKYEIIYKLVILIFLNFYLYIFIKKYFGGFL